MASRPGEQMDDEEVTLTLKGLGPLTVDACPACHVGRERPVIDADLAAAFGIALVIARGTEVTRKLLCRRHLSWVDVLGDEIAGGDATGKAMPR